MGSPSASKHQRGDRPPHRLLLTLTGALTNATFTWPTPAEPGLQAWVSANSPMPAVRWAARRASARSTKWFSDVDEIGRCQRRVSPSPVNQRTRSEEHTSELQ